MAYETVPSDPAVLAEAVEQLSALDPVIAKLAGRHGLPILDKRSLVDFTLEGGRPSNSSMGAIFFSELVEVVIHQQLAGKAAIAITERFKAALGGRIDLHAVLSIDSEKLRASGLSGAKISAIRGLAEAVSKGELSLEMLMHLGDQEVIERLSKLRGFGPWSAQMFLMFSLGRLDVWPIGDLGVRKGFQKSYGLDSVPSPKELSLIGERFRPYRSLVAWYMWRSLSE